MSEITAELLQELHWRDFSIMPHDDSQVLVLVYDDHNNAERLLRLLHEKPFDIKILKEDGTSKHMIDLTFLESDLTIRTVFNKTEETYPIAERIANGVKHLSTGIPNPDKANSYLYALKTKIIDELGK